MALFYSLFYFYFIILFCYVLLLSYYLFIYSTLTDSTKLEFIILLVRICFIAWLYIMLRTVVYVHSENSCPDRGDKKMAAQFVDDASSIFLKSFIPATLLPRRDLLRLAVA